MKKHKPAFGGLDFPLRLFLSLLVVVGGMELLLMLFMPLLLPDANRVVLGIVDALLLALLISPFLYFLISREVKERRRVEEAMAERSRELTRSNVELEEFAYAVSHDLREPLRMIHIYLQLLGRRYSGQLDKEADDFIAFAIDGAGRMQKLISDLLDYSRVGSRSLELAPMESGAALAQALENLRLAIAECGATITRDPLPVVMADESQLVRLFQNLVANALKFHGKEPLTVHVGVEREADEWLFSVRDNGIGIAPEHFEKIFLIFKRVYSREEYPGTGIGLALCKKIVERHGGRIWVESEPERGATFFLTLPATGG